MKGIDQVTNVNVSPCC